MNFDASCVTKLPKFLPTKQCHLYTRSNNSNRLLEFVQFKQLTIYIIVYTYVAGYCCSNFAFTEAAISCSVVNEEIAS